MIINPKCTSLLKYRSCQKVLEAYYRRKMACPCFLMEQNHRWTVVTLNCEG